MHLLGVFVWACWSVAVGKLEPSSGLFLLFPFFFIFLLIFFQHLLELS
jgi:hypothetical protein